MSLIILKAKSMVAIDKYEYYYVQSKNSIMRNSSSSKTKRKLEDKLGHFDNLVKEIENYKIEKKTKENFKIFLTYSLLAVVNELEKENKKWYIKELKKRKIAKNIKIRNFKQLVKRLILEIKY